MKILSVFLLCLCGCTVTNIDAPTFKMRRVSILQRVAVPRVTVATNGTVSLEGYANDGGSDAAAKVTAAAIAAALKAGL